MKVKLIEINGRVSFIPRDILWIFIGWTVLNGGKWRMNGQLRRCNSEHFGVEREESEPETQRIWTREFFWGKEKGGRCSSRGVNTASGSGLSFEKRRRRRRKLVLSATNHRPTTRCSANLKCRHFSHFLSKRGFSGAGVATCPAFNSNFPLNLFKWTSQFFNKSKFAYDGQIFKFVSNEFCCHFNVNVKNRWNESLTRRAGD